MLEERALAPGRTPGSREWVMLFFQGGVLDRCLLPGRSCRAEVGWLFWQLSQGNLLLNQDGLTNSGFVWEEVCVSQELDGLRELA